jgi:hypothetical protein
LAYRNGREEAVEVLHVGDITAEADNGARVKFAEAFNVGEAGEGTV